MGNSMGKILGFWSPSVLNQGSSSKKPGRLSGRDPPEDVISSLPDEILELILSFLTCKERAKTSLVSRRWLHLWLHTQVLHFDTPVNYRLEEIPSYEECRKFVNQVNHGLTLHKSQNLNEFRITFFLDKRFEKDISCWLGFALKRKVENLELNFMLDGTYPSHVANAYDFSDRFLKLNSEKTVQVVNPDRRGNCFVNCLDFRSLKSLSLKCVNVTGEAVDFILRNSPFLEKLEVVGSLELHSLVISDPKLMLKHLRIDQNERLGCVSISNINLVTLKTMTLTDLRLTNLPKLVDLFISGHGKRIRRVFSECSCCHSQLESLTLQSIKIQCITQLSGLDHLTKLKRLDIRVVYLDTELIELVSVVEACPCLEEFVLMLGQYSRCMRLTGTSVANAEKRPLKCLKVFEFMGYYGRIGELELVMHILENSVALEKIVLDPFSPVRHIPPSLEDEEARNAARKQFEGLKESIQPRVVIR